MLTRGCRRLPAPSWPPTARKAVITDFLAAAANPSIWARYTHTVDALLIMGAFVAMAVAAWYLLKGKHTDFAMKTLKTGAVVGIVTSCIMIVFAHASAVVVAEEQPTKLAMMEGMYETEAPPLYAFGWVDEESQEVITPFWPFPAAPASLPRARGTPSTWA